MANKPNCYECYYRRKIPGNAHTRCGHPDTRLLEIDAKEYGIKNGWFYWPMNFDPVWLLKCTGFKKKKND